MSSPTIPNTLPPRRVAQIPSPQKEYLMNIRTNPIVRGLRRHWPKAVAVLALGISLGGTAYASGVLLPPASVGSVQLKRGAVTASKLAANAITAQAVKRGTLLRADF